MPIKFDMEPTVRPICFPSIRDFIDNGSGIVAGWGNIKYEGDSKSKSHIAYSLRICSNNLFTGVQSSTLHYVSLNVVDHEECKKKFVAISSAHLCAGGGGEFRERQFMFN